MSTHLTNSNSRWKTFGRWALSLVGERRVLDSDGREKIGALLIDAGIQPDDLDYFVDEVKYLQGRFPQTPTG